MRQAKTLLFALVFLFCFFAVAFFRVSFYDVNLSINLWAESINTDFFTLPAKVISIAFDTPTLIALLFVLEVFFFVFHKRRYGFLLLGTVAGEVLLVESCKAIIASPRPLNELVATTGYSFPSGHVTDAVVFFGVLTYIAWGHWTSNKDRALVTTGYVSLVIIISFDRIYLNVHWLSDVIGAVFLGAFWLTFCIYAFNRILLTRGSSESSPTYHRNKP